MKAIHAIYERGVFRPLEAVDLPETTEVVFEPRPVLPPSPPGAGESGGPSLLDLAAHAEPMGVLTNAEIDHAIYGG